MGYWTVRDQGNRALAVFHTYGELAARYHTGRVRGRIGWFGRIVMQIEICSPKPRYPQPPDESDVWAGGSYTFWRDATREDMANGLCVPQTIKEAPCPAVEVKLAHSLPG